MNNWTIILVSVLITTLTSCGTNYKVVRNETHDHAAIIPGKTFAFIKSEGKLPDGLMESDYQTICKFISAQLLARGFIADEKADLLLKIGLTEAVKAESKDIIPDWAPYWVGPKAAMYRSYYDNTQLVSDIAAKGYLIMDIIDTKTDEVVYDAAISGDIGDGNLLKNVRLPQSMIKIATGLFKDFPIEVSK